MDSRKLIVLGILVVSLFIFLVTVLVFVYSLSSVGQPVPGFLQLFIEFHIHFMVLMGLFGVLSGLIVYRLTSSSIESHKKLMKTNLGIIMKFLSDDERKTVKHLLSKGGTTTQGEIGKALSISRLKAHRIVRKLEERGVIHAEKHGKINMVRIVDELKGTA